MAAAAIKQESVLARSLRVLVAAIVAVGIDPITSLLLARLTRCFA